MLLVHIRWLQRTNLMEQAVGLLAPPVLPFVVHLRLLYGVVGGIQNSEAFLHVADIGFGG